MKATLKVRWDLLAIFSLSLGICLALRRWLPWRSPNGVFQLWLVAFIGFFFLTEALSWEAPAKTELKSGRWNALISSLALPLILFISQWGITPLRFPGILLLGTFLFATGIVVRWLAKYQLKDFFSYSLRIQSKHTLIQQGLYSKIRHPSYLGTWLILLSLPLLFKTWGPYPLWILFLPMTYRQIQQEDAMLATAFGEDFHQYKRKVPSIIPFKGRKK